MNYNSKMRRAWMQRNEAWKDFRWNSTSTNVIPLCVHYLSMSAKYKYYDRQHNRRYVAPDLPQFEGFTPFGDE